MVARRLEDQHSSGAEQNPIRTADVNNFRKDGLLMLSTCSVCVQHAKKQQLLKILLINKENVIKLLLNTCKHFVLMIHHLTHYTLLNLNMPFRIFNYTFFFSHI